MEFIFENNEGRLDKFLASKISRLSRSQLQKAVRAGAVKINGRSVIKSGFVLKNKDRVTILDEKLPIFKNAAIHPESDIPLNIIYEDEDVAVINKQAGLLTHPTPAHLRHTLVNALLARYPEIKNVGDPPAGGLRPGIVHRLDKGTSGLIVAAKNQKAFLFLKNQFLNRTVTKKYFALVEGVPKQKEGIIEYAIRPSKQNRLKKVAVHKPEINSKKSVRAAKTRYKVIKKIGNEFALVELRPLTGRTHQLRVHLAAIGHPIVGDSLYGAKPGPLDRPFLHAYYLKFELPNGMPIALEAELPKDLREFLSELSEK